MPKGTGKKGKKTAVPVKVEQKEKTAVPVKVEQKEKTAVPVKVEEKEKTAVAVNVEEKLTRSTGVQNDQIQDQMVQDLIELQYLGSLMGTRSNRDWVAENVDGITRGDMNALADMCESVFPSSLRRLEQKVTDKRRNNDGLVLHGDRVSRCREEGKKFASRSEQKIALSSLSYSDLNAKMKMVMASSFITKGITITQDFSMACIYILWDFDNCTVPRDNPATFIYTNLLAELRRLGYNGLVVLKKGYGNMGSLHKDKVKELKTFKLVHVAKTKLQGKDVADKKLIVETIASVFEGLITHQEPQVVVIATGDVDFVTAVEEAIRRGFHVIIVYEDSGRGSQELLDYVTKFRAKGAKVIMWSKIAPKFYPWEI